MTINPNFHFAMITISIQLWWIEQLRIEMYFCFWFLECPLVRSLFRLLPSWKLVYKRIKYFLKLRILSLHQTLHFDRLDIQTIYLNVKCAKLAHFNFYSFPYFHTTWWLEISPILPHWYLVVVHAMVRIYFSKQSYSSRVLLPTVNIKSLELRLSLSRGCQPIDIFSRGERLDQ